MNKYVILVLLAGLCAGAGNLSAAIAIEVTDTDASWQNATGGGSPTTTVSSGGVARIRWGNSTGKGQSGYDFDPTDSPYTVNLNDPFSLGKFTHRNRPITGGAITSVELHLDLDFKLSNGATTTFASTLEFLFNHNETPNASGPPASDDLVNVSNLVSTDMFKYGGQTYNLSIVGFSTDGGNTIVNQFRSPEKKKNKAYIYAEIAVAPIPEPSAIITAISAVGFIGLIVMRRLRRKQA